MTITVKPPEQLEPDLAAEYVRQLTGCQNQLYGYIYTLLSSSRRGTADSAWDVLQETNAVLWSKATEYDASRPFLPWAMGMAFQQVRAARTRFGRDRLVFQDEQTLEVLSQQMISEATGRSATGQSGTGQTANARELAMEGCLKKLTSEQQQIVDQYYQHEQPIKAIATTIGRSASSVGVILHRVRLSLAKCIEQTINQSVSGKSTEGQS